MPHRFFISHYNGDKNIAEIFSNTLRRITLEQISPWFSSDSYEGLKPGNIWFNNILSKLEDSKAVVALLTPNSLNRPWIYFESGIAQALEDCDVIPICIGVGRDSILPPLGLYQCYQLNDYRSAVELFSKLLSLFDIKFDEEMSRLVLERMIAQISHISFESESDNKESRPDVETMIQDLKSHLDKRFIEILDKPTYQIQGDKLNIEVNENKVNKLIGTTNQPSISYSVAFKIDFPAFKNTLFIDIRESDTVDSITTSLYFMLRDFVAAYTYMETWIIKNEKSGKYVIVREVANLVQAKMIFTPDSTWIVEKLKKPYVATDSGPRVT